MNKYWLLLSCLLVPAIFIYSQTADDTLALPPADSLRVEGFIIKGQDSIPQILLSDSFSKRPKQDAGWWLKTDIPFSIGTVSWQIMEHHPWFGFGSAASQLQQETVKRRPAGKELLFYLIAALLIAYGFLKMLFPKYFSDLFRLFFRTTIKQRQIKEQLIQTPLPSLLLNAFFVISTSLYITFVLQHFDMNPTGSFWLLLLYCCTGLTVVYFIKFAGLKISGWIFSMEEAADSYIFIVFVINKMIGVLLLPFLVLIAFTMGELYSIGLTLSWCLIGGMLIYRFILTYAAVRNQVKVNPFHFFLYLCAFEIAPLLLIYKGLLLFFRIST